MESEIFEEKLLHRNNKSVSDVPVINESVKHDLVPHKSNVWYYNIFYVHIFVSLECPKFIYIFIYNYA